MRGFGEGGFGEGPFGSVRETAEEIAPEIPEEIIQMFEVVEDNLQTLNDDFDREASVARRWRWIMLILTILGWFWDDLITILV